MIQKYCFYLRLCKLIYVNSCKRLRLYSSLVKKKIFLLKNQAILLLGSNLGQKDHNLQIAKERIAQSIGEIVGETKKMVSEPWGFLADDEFCNQILVVKTDKSPMSLLLEIKNLEFSLGRNTSKVEVLDDLIKDGPYQSRIIDVDILYFNSLSFKSQYLQIPHPLISQRKFVLDLLDQLKLGDLQ
ncbi:MAG: 2-amino-4-hydroxy-6-hydroxymethyldihydropteridine diphosphokinase [Flavobacteriaceae bacterium]|nr:MAG: 2-amino-4-hydroxy-6-hydroxymethyldihydropteridine diphosphokinase [Flavobacteriaceae bacterium]